MDTIGNGERSDMAAPPSLHDLLREHAADLSRIASDLADAETEDGEYEDADFNIAISRTTALAVEVLDAIGDHGAAEAVRQS